MRERAHAVTRRAARPGQSPGGGQQCLEAFVRRGLASANRTHWQLPLVRASSCLWKHCSRQWSTSDGRPRADQRVARGRAATATSAPGAPAQRTVAVATGQPNNNRWLPKAHRPGRAAERELLVLPGLRARRPQRLAARNSERHGDYDTFDYRVNVIACPLQAMSLFSTSIASL